MSEDVDRPSPELSAAQRSLLEKRIQEARRIASSSPPRIRRRADLAAPVPLSSAQQRLWVLDQLVPGNRAYNLTRTLRVEGPLSDEALRRSVEEVVARHESLRTTFANREGQPVQIVAEKPTVPFSVVSLEHLPEAQRMPRALERALEDAEDLFDLSTGPLLRATLMRLAPELHVLQVTAHHIAADGWSMEVFFREVSILYDAFSSGEVRPLEPLDVQYPDFCIWQREFLESPAAAAQIAKWAEHLRGVGSLDLPTDRARPTVPTLRGAYHTRLFSKRRLDALAAVSRERGATLFMTLLAAFNVFLQRHTGQDDLSVAAPIAGRNLPELENLIGFFANTIVLRSDLSGDPTFREVLARVREAALESYTHQDVPLEKIVETLRPERSLAVNPIAQVLGVLQNVPLAPLRLKRAKVTPLESWTRTSRFDLELHATETADGLACTLVGSSDLFEEKSLERMLARFETLTDSIVRTPDLRISELDLLPETERAEIVSDWNPPSRDFASGRPIYEFLEDRADRSPDSVAAEFEDRRLSYAELNRKANQLASHLRALGAGPGVLVGVCLDRSLEMVIALIAVLKSGGAYVPLDPEYPAERLAFMLADAQTPVLVTASKFRSLFPEQSHVRVCSIDADAETIGARDSGNPTRLVSSEDPAYVIYTSGSTGKPKGVVVTHRNIDRLFTATEPWFHFDERDVWTLFHSYAFDFSVWELWGALRYGGRLVIVPGSVARSPEAFRALLVRSGTTVLNQTPSALRQLIAQDEISTDPLALRFVILGGEALDPGMLRPWFDRHGDEAPRIVNMYGITETTVHVTYRVIAREDLRQPAVSAIGRPIPDLQVYILDDRLRL
ncbi:MAG TPA: condensation domain-containing protein, partial [Thermoanaerobaculia bacterium]